MTSTKARKLHYQALSCVILTLKCPLLLNDRRLETKKLEDRKLAVIGGFCVQHYLGGRRETQVVLHHSLICFLLHVYLS